MGGGQPGGGVRNTAMVAVSFKPRSWTSFPGRQVPEPQNLNVSICIMGLSAAYFLRLQEESRWGEPRTEANTLAAMLSVSPFFLVFLSIRTQKRFPYCVSTPNPEAGIRCPDQCYPSCLVFHFINIVCTFL